MHNFVDAENKFYRYDFFNNGEQLPSRVFYETQCYRKYFYATMDDVRKVRIVVPGADYAN